MNKEINELANELHCEMSRLYLILEQCRQLYTTPETVSILNKTASVFFQVVQSQFFDALLLGISRLTDKAETGGRKNLSINTMCRLILDQQLNAEVFELCEQAHCLSGFAREHRNKRISHLDLKYHTNRESFPLDIATFTKIENSLKAIEKVIDLVFRRLMKTTVIYKFINLQGSADVLVGKLKQMDMQAQSCSKIIHSDI